MDEDLIRQNFGKIWPIHVRNFTEHLIACRKSIGDLDLVIILAAVGDRTLSERRTDKSLNYTKLFHEQEGLPEPEAINTQSISDFTGIPRESVRRKLNELIERGWVAKDASGFLSVTGQCAKDLAPTTEHGMTYLSRMFALFADLQSKS